MIIRMAHLKDVPEIADLINNYAKAGLMLPRSHPELIELIRGFSVAEEEIDIVACCNARIWGGSNEIEIASLVVDEKHQRKGIGTKLVRFCMDEAIKLGFTDFFALTYRREFFEKLGFRLDRRESLSQKAWTDCIRCPKYHCCDENVMRWEKSPSFRFPPKCGRDEE
ncbi:MAG: N-acetyltransferase [Bacillota bacterium]